MMIKELISGTAREQRAGEKIAFFKAKGKLSGIEEKLLKQALKERRPLRNRRISFGIAMLVAVGLATLALTQSTQGSWLTIEDADKFGNRNTELIKQAAKDWDQKYHCDRRVIVKFNSNLGVNYLPDRIDTTVEIASPGLIQMNNEGDTRHEILHALTHACQPDQPTPITPFQIPSGDKTVTITGYHGGSLMVVLPTGEGTGFRFIEEGIAERNASYFKGSKSENSQYNQLRIEAEKDFPSDFPVEEYMKKNDVPSIIGEILDLPSGSTVTPQDITTAMRKYQQAWDRAGK